MYINIILKLYYLINKIVMKIKNNISEIMEREGITGYRLAKDTGIRESYIYSKIKKENFNPNISTAFKIAEYIGVGLDDLFEVIK